MVQRQRSAAGGERSHARYSFEMAVEYVVQGTDPPVHATLYNLGAGGMYFETHKPLSPGVKLHIRLLDYSPDVHGEHEAYLGQVAWSGKVDRGPDPLYGVGVRFLKKESRQAGTGMGAAGARYREN